jgi:hypothetical protein
LKAASFSLLISDELYSITVVVAYFLERFEPSPLYSSVFFSFETTKMQG